MKKHDLPGRIRWNVAAGASIVTHSSILVTPVRELAGVAPPGGIALTHKAWGFPVSGRLFCHLHALSASLAGVGETGAVLVTVKSGVLCRVKW